MLKKTIFLQHTIYSIMKETFDSILDSVKDRFTNPFLGTFIFVWIIRNWYLVYAIFAFDKNCTIDDKLEYIKHYFKGYNVFYEFLYNACWAIGLLIAMYILLIGVQYLMRTYQLLVNKANAYFDKLPVESMTHYQSLNEQFKILTEKYKTLDSKSNEQLTDLQVKETNILELKTNQADFDSTIKQAISSFLYCFPYRDLLEQKSDKSLLLIEHDNFIDPLKKWIDEKELSHLYYMRLNLLFIQLKDTNLENYIESRYLKSLKSNPELNQNNKTEYTNKLATITMILTKVNHKEEESYNDITKLFQLFGREINEGPTSIGLLVLKDLFKY